MTCYHMSAMMSASTSRIRALAPESVYEIRERMVELGFPVPEIQKIRGATALFMKDPDGIRFEITHYPPGAKVAD